MERGTAPSITPAGMLWFKSHCLVFDLALVPVTSDKLSERLPSTETRATLQRPDISRFKTITTIISPYFKSVATYSPSKNKAKRIELRFGTLRKNCLKCNLGNNCRP